MVNPWFKFYGGEFLADPKMDALDANERSCWLTILCLASQSFDGVIRYTTEQKIIEKANVLEGQRSNYQGVLKKFESLQMLEQCNESVTLSFKPANWEKRQYAEGYSRLKRYREKGRNDSDNASETPMITTEERRREEKREEEKRERAQKFKPPTLEEVKKYCTERKNKINPQRFVDYYQSNGWQVGRNKMKDWKAAIRTWEQKETPQVEQKIYQTKKK